MIQFLNKRSFFASLDGTTMCLRFVLGQLFHHDVGFAVSIAAPLILATCLPTTFTLWQLRSNHMQFSRFNLCRIRHNPPNSSQVGLPYPSSPTNDAITRRHPGNYVARLQWHSGPGVYGTCNVHNKDTVQPIIIHGTHLHALHRMGWPCANAINGVG